MAANNVSFSSRPPSAPPPEVSLPALMTDTAAALRQHVTVGALGCGMALAATAEGLSLQVPPRTDRTTLAMHLKAVRFLFQIARTTGRHQANRLWGIAAAYSLGALLEGYLLTVSAAAAAHLVLGAASVARPVVLLRLAAVLLTAVVAGALSRQLQGTMQARAEAKLRSGIGHYFEQRYWQAGALHRALSFAAAHVPTQVRGEARHWCADAVNTTAAAARSSALLVVLTAVMLRRWGLARTASVAAQTGALRVLAGHPTAQRLVLCGAAVNTLVVASQTADVPVRGERLNMAWSWAFTSLLVGRFSTACADLHAAVARLFPRLASSSVALYRLEEGLNGVRARVLKHERRPPHGLIAPSPTVAFDRVHLRAVPAQAASQILVRNLTFEAPAGNHVAIVGPRGSGRSSILRILGEYYPLFEGVVHRPPPDSLLYVPKRAFLPHLTLKEQLLYPATGAARLGEDRLLGLLARLGVDHVFEHEGAAWDLRCDALATTLSEQEQQLVALARILYHKPEYALLDEATAALSPEQERRVYDVCNADHITVIAVVHDARAVPLHDKILTLDGRGGYTMTSV